MKLSNILASLFLLVAGAVLPAQAAFIVETTAGGKALANFGYGGDTTSASVSVGTHGLAPGLTPTINSVYGGNGSTVDTYTYSYTPGTDGDNTVFAAGADLGNGNVASGETGGATGLYNVYATWPTSNNISGGVTTYSISGDTLTAQLGVNQDSDVNPTLGNGWLLIGQVDLTAGSTYVLTQESGAATFVSMRSAGAMFEFVGAVVPEPASLALLGLASLGLGCLRTRK